MKKDDSKPEGKKIGWHLLNTKRIYQSPWYNLRQDIVSLSNGKQLNYTYVEHPGAVFIVPITINQEVILIRSYRYTIDDWCWEVPAGGLGDKTGLLPEEVACQELAEEIGGEATILESLGWYYMANGFAQLKNYLFLAHDVTVNQQPQREDSEIIDRFKPFPLKQVLDMVKNGDIRDGESAFAIMLAVAKLPV